MKTGIVFILLLFPTKMFSQHLDSIDRRQLDTSLLKNFVRGYHWRDKQGDNNLLLYKSVRFGKIEGGTQMRYVEFKAVNFRSLRKDKRVAVWEYNDSQEECHEDNDLIARFITYSFRITDLDNDGTCEVWGMYKMSCRTDISPAKLKLIMHEGKKEFIISGHTKVGHTEDTYLGGDQTPDSNFQSGPKEFSDYGQKLFEKFINEDWE
jgi:hypothetical protein